jgi:NADPH:quinone reductase-like Zn-dependent oxidoreductase
MKAIVLTKGGTAEVLGYQDFPDPQPGPRQARVRLKAAGLNHRDVWHRMSYTGPAPMILGSDGAGVVDAVGADVERAWVGREVVINPGLYWGDREDVQSPAFQILGSPSHGTYAEAVVVPAENLARKPAHLDFLQAAALPLAGVTAWRALFTQGGLTPGETVLLPGIGSGVAGVALRIAKLAGARVVVTSSRDDKLKKALAEGADFAVNYTAPDWESMVRDFVGEDGIDLAVDHSGEQSVPIDLRLVRPGGRVVTLGSTTGTHPRLNLRELYVHQVRLVGTYMGSPREFAAMMRFVRLHRLTPEVHHVFPLRDAAEAQRLMESAEQYGKILLRI